MGRKPRQKPVRLADKLIRIRTELGLSQNGLIGRLGLTDELRQSHISGFEIGTREPSLVVILQYARIAKVPVDVLIDDSLDLPEHLPAKNKTEWLNGYKRRRSR